VNRKVAGAGGTRDRGELSGRRNGEVFEPEREGLPHVVPRKVWKPNGRSGYEEKGQVDKKRSVGC